MKTKQCDELVAFKQELLLFWGRGASSLRHLTHRLVVVVGFFWLKVEWPEPDCPFCVLNCVM